MLRKTCTFASCETCGLSGNSTCFAPKIVFSVRILCCESSSPKGLFPNSSWKKITPTDHTSTLEEIFGGDLPPKSKHSGGRYL